MIRNKMTRLVCALALAISLASVAEARVVLNSGQSLKVVMAGAAATTNPTALVETSDQGGETGVTSTAIALNGVTAVTLAEAAGPTGTQVFVNSVSIYNGDTAAVVVTLNKVVGGTSFPIAKTTLQVGDTFQLGADGIRVTDTSGQAKTSSSTTALLPLGVRPSDWRVHDAISTLLPTTAANDDLGAINGTDGTAFHSLQTIDFGTTTASALARTWIALPSNYVAGSAITIRVRAGMITTVSDGTATVDLSVYSNDGDATGSADLCTTAATTINSLTFADKDFVITPTSLVAGQLLNVKLTVAGSDTGTGPAVIGAVAHVELRTSCSQ